MPSTVIADIGYDEATKIMCVTFVDGDLYAYFGVPAETWLAFRRSGVKGRFFAHQIRPKFSCRKIGPGDRPDGPPQDDAAKA